LLVSLLSDFLVLQLSQSSSFSPSTVYDVLDEHVELDFSVTLFSLSCDNFEFVISTKSKLLSFKSSKFTNVLLLLKISSNISSSKDVIDNVDFIDELY